MDVSISSVVDAAIHLITEKHPPSSVWSSFNIDFAFRKKACAESTANSYGWKGWGQQGPSRFSSRLVIDVACTVVLTNGARPVEQENGGEVVWTWACREYCLEWRAVRIQINRRGYRCTIYWRSSGRCGEVSGTSYRTLRGWPGAGRAKEKLWVAGG